jgi:beta-phosphoglucomutase-like phosphatase (HAD superfamily)
MTCVLIFDFDGLILDTETLALISTQVMYKEHGHELTLESLTRHEHKYPKGPLQ